MNVKAGQKVFVRTVGNYARNGEEVTEETVSKVGNKYFYLEGFYREKFSKETGVEESKFLANYRAYETMQEILDENERRHILKSLPDLDRIGLSLRQLRAIKDIINGNWGEEK